MGMPRIGVGLPTFGPHAGPESVVAVARAAEDAGFHSVSATERLLLPARPDWSNDAMLPESHVWDPLEMLTWAAAHTRRVRLATAIVNALFQPPIVLARRLATLDRLSGGRLDAGLGQGGGGTAATSFCLPEEFVASGVPRSRRGSGFVEHLAAMGACWGTVQAPGGTHGGPRRHEEAGNAEGGRGRDSSGSRTTPTRRPNEAHARKTNGSEVVVKLGAGKWSKRSGSGLATDSDVG